MSLNLFNGDDDPLIRQFESAGFDEFSLKPQKQINEYLIKYTLGRGSFAKVFMAIHQITGVKYALKRFRLKELQRVENGVSQLEREISVMRHYKHPNIIKLHEVLFLEEFDTVYLVLDFADAGSLKQLISHPIPVDEKMIRSIFHQILTALNYLHQEGMIHQDIKPSNILLCSNGVSYLADFGVGHSIQSTEMVVGSPAYQAPEALTDGEGEAVSENPVKEDVWSLGVTLYESLFFKLPFNGETVFEIIRNIRENPLSIPDNASPDVKDVITKMLCIDQDKRLSVQELLNHPYFARPSGLVSIPVANIMYHSSEKSTEIMKYKAEICNNSWSFSRPGLSSPEVLRQINLEHNVEITAQTLIEEDTSKLPIVPLTSDGCCLIL